jgi:ABC-type transporter Mla subunit MlaD
MSSEEEVRDLRARLEQLERERADEIARANAAVAAAQDKSYWLDRWHVDLNQLMRRPGASEARAALRALRSVYRFLYDLRSRSRGAVGDSRARLRKVRRTVAEERAAAERVAAASARDPAEG